MAVDSVNATWHHHHYLSLSPQSVEFFFYPPACLCGAGQSNTTTTVGARPHHQPCLFRLVLALVHLDDLSCCLSICVCFCTHTLICLSFSDSREFTVGHISHSEHTKNKKRLLPEKQIQIATKVKQLGEQPNRNKKNREDFQD